MPGEDKEQIMGMEREADVLKIEDRARASGSGREISSAEGNCVEENRIYELRDLKDKDLFRMLKILKKIGIGDFKQAFYQVASGEKAIRDVGIDVALDMADILIGKIGIAEEEIYALWGDLSGLAPEEIREMEFGTLPLMIMDTFTRARNTSFFKAVSKLL